MNTNERHINWIKTILKEVSKLDDNKGIAILNKCGEECSMSSKLLKGAVKVNKEYKEAQDLDTIFDAYKNQYYNTSRLSIKDNKITLIFEECTCPLVENGVDNPYMCNCTLGYSKKIFETLFNRPVTVELKQSILRGDKLCEQKIYIDKHK